MWNDGNLMENAWKSFKRSIPFAIIIGDLGSSKNNDFLARKVQLKIYNIVGRSPIKALKSILN
jgi:hypothetical protein